MLFPTLATLVHSHAAIATPAGDPSTAPAVWMLPVVSVTAAACWYMHWRWRKGRYFMSRFTTAAREAAKLAWFGHVLLPCAIGCTAATAMFAIWDLWGLPTNVWSGYLFLALAVVCVGAGAWAFKERHWPSKRRTPAWARDK